MQPQRTGDFARLPKRAGGHTQFMGTLVLVLVAALLVVAGGEAVRAQCRAMLRSDARRTEWARNG